MFLLGKRSKVVYLFTKHSKLLTARNTSVLKTGEEEGLTECNETVL